MNFTKRLHLGVRGTKVMKPGHTLFQCDISNGATVRVLYRLWGGASGNWTFRASGSAVFAMRRGVGPQRNDVAGVTLRETIPILMVSW